MTEQELAKIAARLRYWSLRMSTKAGSGHPTSSLSAADLMAVLLTHLKYNVAQPENMHNDRLIFSKGHASPLYYALYEAMGVLSQEELLGYRTFDSALEGHPTPRFPHTVVATGSLGMGLGFGSGVALGLKRHNSEGRVWVLLGDGEMAEGSVWESLSFAATHNLGNLIAIIDVNRLGQSGPTAFGHDVSTYQKRLEAFGWNTVVIDGHNFGQIDAAYRKALHSQAKPTAIIAKTVKGKGVTFLEDQEGWHGKALGTEELDRAVKELGTLETKGHVSLIKPSKTLLQGKALRGLALNAAPYKKDQEIAVREALGDALAELAKKQRSLIVFDGDVGNSTFTEKVKEVAPEQFIECYIAEQQMTMAAVGIGKVGFYPVAATFASFWTRAFDQLRMAALSEAKMLVIGTHVGVSIGQDGPSQMGLEDIAMMRTIHNSIVLSPADAVSAWALLPQAMSHTGISYIRATRGKTPLLYNDPKIFKVGGSAVVQSSKDDAVTIVATGITVHEALKAYEQLKKQGIVVRVIDAYSIKPIDVKTLHAAAVETSHLITVEDHWFDGGLGDAVLNAFVGYDHIIPHITKLAVHKMPRSGKPEELLDDQGISAKQIVEAVKQLIT